MDKGFTVDDNANNFLSLPDKMMSCFPSEYAFQYFPEPLVTATTTTSYQQRPSQNDDVVEIPVEPTTDSAKTTSLGVKPAEANVSIGSEEYQAYLKSSLYLACAAVASLQRGNCMEPRQDSAATTMLLNKGLKASISSHGPVVLPKSARKMLSNREYARRCRRRKQVYLEELETQVSQLKVENSSLLKRLDEVSQKYNEIAVDNRILKANVETLRTKMKIAEEKIRSLMVHKFKIF